MSRINSSSSTIRIHLRDASQVAAGGHAAFEIMELPPSRHQQAGVAIVPRNIVCLLILLLSWAYRGCARPLGVAADVRRGWLSGWNRS
jgi:hypothetical protein